MNVFTCIIYFLLVILFILYIYFIRKENQILEGALDVMDQTVFGQKVDSLKITNQYLENTLDKINKTYGDLKSQEIQQTINETTIKEKREEVNVVSKQIADEYKLITNSVQPIMFLKLGQNINNDANIDTKILTILNTTHYNKVNQQNSTYVNFKGKYSLALNGNKNKHVYFTVIPTLTQFSFSFWIYNDKVNNNDPIISIMNSRDFNAEIKNSGLKVYIKNNQVIVNYNNITLTNNAVNSGWNHITFTSDKTNSCLYVNGTNIQSSIYKAAPIQPLPDSYETLYRLNTYFIIGGTSFIGNIYNVRYYAIGIPPKIVSDIYNLDIATKSNS